MKIAGSGEPGPEDAQDKALATGTSGQRWGEWCEEKNRSVYSHALCRRPCPRRTSSIAFRTLWCHSWFISLRAVTTLKETAVSYSHVSLQQLQTTHQGEDLSWENTGGPEETDTSSISPGEGYKPQTTGRDSSSFSQPACRRLPAGVLYLMGRL